MRAVGKAAQEALPAASPLANDIFEGPILGTTKAKLEESGLFCGRKRVNDGLDLASQDQNYEPLCLAQRTMSVTGDYVFRVMRDFSELCGNDVTAALVFITVTQAVTQHLRVRGALPGDLDGAFFKDTLRRPAAVSGIAEAIGLPVETVRRKAIKLASAGLMKRTEHGRLMVDTEVLTRSDVLAVVLKNRGNADAMQAKLSRLAMPKPTCSSGSLQTSIRPEGGQAILTARENEVLALLIEGETTKDVALRLRLSPRTIDNFRSRIIRKMNAKNIAAVATQVARQRGPVQIS
jgi:DNA-binding CsgD family transcriptional regulator